MFIGGNETFPAGACGEWFRISYHLSALTDCPYGRTPVGSKSCAVEASVAGGRKQNFVITGNGLPAATVADVRPLPTCAQSFPHGLALRIELANSSSRPIRSYLETGHSFADSGFQCSLAMVAPFRVRKTILYK